MRTLAVLLAVAAIAGSVIAAAAVGSSGAEQAQVIRFIDVSGSGIPVGDAARHQNPVPGDQVLIRDSLFAWNGAKRGNRLGYAEANLAFRSGFAKGGASAYLVGQFFLKGGSVLVEGFVHISQGPSAFLVPVVGGTGRYAGARGTLSTHDLDSNGSKSSMTLRLVPAA